MSGEVIYEVECRLDPAVVADFDDWLPGHVREVLACPGFIDASIERLDPVPGEAPRRRSRYRLDSAAALQRYLEQDAPRLRANARERYGDRLHCERRVLQPGARAAAPGREPPRCLDCGAAVTGVHCAGCGQPRDTHVLTVGEVAHDFTHSVLHLDGRVWRTLRDLVLRPGQLSRAYIAGQRQRYLPPFRIYLVISVLFFALSALLPGDAVRLDPRAERYVEPVTLDARELPSSATWLEQRLRPALEAARADGGRRLARTFASAAPKLMFLFLPLMALVTMAFYRRPRRLYAEHLVAFLHTHSLAFLLLSATALLGALQSQRFPGSGLLALPIAALYLYIPVYVFRSMRIVYGEGRARTTAKFLALGLVYLLLLSVTMLAGLLYSALSQ